MAREWPCRKDCGSARSGFLARLRADHRLPAGEQKVGSVKSDVGTVPTRESDDLLEQEHVVGILR